jgi:hypothetical protein
MQDPTNETPADTGTTADVPAAETPRPITVKQLSHTLQQERYDHKNLPVHLADGTPVVAVALDKENSRVVLTVGDKPAEEK